MQRRTLLCPVSMEKHICCSFHPEGKEKIQCILSVNLLATLQQLSILQEKVNNHYITLLFLCFINLKLSPLLDITNWTQNFFSFPRFCPPSTSSAVSATVFSLLLSKICENKKWSRSIEIKFFAKFQCQTDVRLGTLTLPSYTDSAKTVTVQFAHQNVTFSRFQSWKLIIPIFLFSQAIYEIILLCLT